MINHMVIHTRARLMAVEWMAHTYAHSDTNIIIMATKDRQIGDSSPMQYLNRSSPLRAYVRARYSWNTHLYLQFRMFFFS